MNKSERRYFHAYAHRSGTRSPHYYTVYTEVNVLKTWDALLLDNALQQYPFYSQKAVIKHQLYHNLLDALHLYHREQDQEEQLKRQLHQVYLLLTRDLPEQADKLLRRAIRQLRTRELYNCWPEALRLQQMLIEQNLRKADQQESIKKWRQEHQRIDDLLVTEQQIKWQKIQVYQQHFYGSMTGNSQAATTTLATTDSLMARADEQQILALQAFQNQQAAQAYQHNRTQLQLLEKLLDQQRGVPARYLSVFYNLLIDQLQLGAYDELYVGLQKLRELPQQRAFRQVNKLAVKTFSWSFQLELNALLQQHDFAQGYRLLTELQQGLKKHQTELGKPVRASLQHLGGLFAFHQQDFDLALSFLTPLYQQRPDLRQPLYRYAHLLYLLTHYELGNHEWLENTLVNTKRSFRQVGIAVDSMEFWLLNLLKELLEPLVYRKKSSRFINTSADTYQADSKLEKFLQLSHWLNRA